MAAILLLVLSVGCSRQSDNQINWNSFEIVELSNQWLWDPTSQSLEEWQILDRPTSIAKSPFGDLIIADSRNSRLIRITLEGDLIEVIGREGEGPGEFEHPIEVCFEPNSSILWVVDHRGMRVSRFYIGEDSSEYISGFRLPFYAFPAVQNLIVHDSHSFWFVTFSGSRISLIDDRAQILRTFGEYHEGEVSSAPLSVSNSGYLNLRSDGNLIFLGESYPRLELWHPSGTLEFSCDVLVPELAEALAEEISSYQERKGRMLGKLYISATATNEQQDMIYFYIHRRDEKSAIYELSSETFQPIRCFRFRDLETPLVSQFIVDDTSEGMQFISLDWEFGVEIIGDYSRQ